MKQEAESRPILARCARASEWQIVGMELRGAVGITEFW